jgi:hypothetical protein
MSNTVVFIFKKLVKYSLLLFLSICLHFFIVHPRVFSYSYKFHFSGCSHGFVFYFQFPVFIPTEKVLAKLGYFNAYSTVSGVDKAVSFKIKYSEFILTRNRSFTL